MKLKKSKVKKIVILVVVIILAIVGARVYSRINQFRPKKTNQPVSEIKSSETRSSVFVNPNSDGTGEGFEELINLMEEEGLNFYKTNNSDGVIGKDDVVILKINCQWHQRGGTNVDLVESVINAIINHPDKFEGEIIVADNGQDQFGSNGDGGSLDWDKANGQDKTRSMLDMVEDFKSNGYKVSGYLWDTITYTKVDEFDSGDMEEGYVVYDHPNEDTKITVSYPKFISENGTYISFKNGIWDENNQSYDSDKLKIINMPVLKTHPTYGITGAVKNYMGVPSEKITKNSHATIGIGSMGTLMGETRMPALTIMDAIYINANSDRSIRQGASSDYDKATFTKNILASTDPIALDYYAAGEVLYPVMQNSDGEIKQIYDRDSIEPGSFGYWLRLSMCQLQKYGYDVVMDEDKIDVHIVD